MWLQGNRLAPVTISSRQIIQTLSEACRSSGVASGYLKAQQKRTEATFSDRSLGQKGLETKLKSILHRSSPILKSYCLRGHMFLLLLLLFCLFFLDTGHKSGLVVYNKLHAAKGEQYLQCIHVANGSTRHYSICYSFLELPEKKDKHEQHAQTHSRKKDIIKAGTF